MIFEKKTAIITGASRGIGKAIAKHLAKLGYTLLLIARTESLLEKLLLSLPGNHQCAAIDISEEEKVKAVINSFLQKEGQVDILFNSAGYVKRGTSALDQGEFQQMLMTNLVGIFNAVQAVVPAMKMRQSGRIYTVASYSGKVARAPLGGYSASKFGVMGFCESLYKELAPFGIHVTTICPSLVDTEMTADVNMPREEMIQVSDIVKTLDFLLHLSPAACIKEISIQCRKRVIDYESF